MSAKTAPSDKTAEKAGEVTDDSMSNLSRAQFSDQLDCHQTLLQAKNSELSRLTDMLKSVRESKEPLAKVKATLQDEINKANKAINAKTEEVTLIKQKLRYHSEKQINENIERLDYQLRNNNYRPREEQKILDEIAMLQRSKKTLREYELKQAENKKYRSERARLIDERNNNFTKVKALYAQEDEIKKAMAELRGVISNSKRTIDQLRQMKPALEKKWVTQQHHQPSVRNKRYEDRKRQRQEHAKTKDQQETRRKLWEKYEASREPYEEECDMCRVLITYLQSAMTSSAPSSARATPSTPLDTPTLPSSDPDYIGSFYLKPKDEDGFIRVSKREKARVKREQRLAKRVKELPHTPDVLSKFTKLSITPPKNTDEIPGTVIALQDALQQYHRLFNEAKTNSNKEKECKGKKEEENEKHTRPTSLAVNPPQLLVTTAITTAPSLTPSTPVYPKLVSSHISQCLPVDSPADAATQASPVLSITPPTVAIQPEPTSGSLDSNRCRSVGITSSPLQTHLSSPLNESRSLEDHTLSRSSTLVTTLRGPSMESPKPPETNLTTQSLPWAAMASQTQTSSKVTAVMCEIPPGQTLGNQEVTCNGAQSPEIITVTETSKFCVAKVPPSHREDIKACNGILPLGDNDSFFSTPISFSGNLVEMNNNAPRSYANVTAKTNVRPAS